MGYPQGAYRQDIIEGYMNGMQRLTHGAAKHVIQEVRDNEPWSMWWYNITGCRNPSSPKLPQCHYQQVHWPLVMTAGWWDIFQTTMLRGYAGVRRDSDPLV